jgi:signal transduction histidine kinase
MTLRRKFLVLALGTIFAPPVAMFIVASIALGLGTGIPAESVMLRFELALLEGRRSGAEAFASAFEEAGAEPTEYRVYEGADLVAGGHGRGDLNEFLFLGDNAEFDVLRTIPHGGSEPVTVIYRSWDRSANASGFRYIGLLAPLTVVVFIAVMSNVIAASINRQIKRLVDATRHVAEGHLDVRVDDEGDDTFGELVRSFNVMSDRVREESAARSRFVLGVSHDLKTPLASISGYMDAIEDGIAETEEDRRKYLGVIREKTRILDHRIRQLIDFLKLETSEWRSTLVSEDLGQLLRETASLVELEARARGVEPRIDVDENLTLVCAHDPDLVLRAMENLIENAFRYGQDFIGLSVGIRTNELVITISNGGPAIPDEDLAFIFEPFYRASKSRRETGFGLGLATVKSVVSSHGWTIHATSEAGRTEVSIRVPCGDGERSGLDPSKRSQST